MARKKKNWTMAEAVAWLRERVKAGETETVESEDVGGTGLDYADGMKADVDPRTCELNGFTFSVSDVECWPEEDFVWEADWGECTSTAQHGEELTWVTDPSFSDALDENLADEYHRLLRAYVKPEWFDPSEAWFPEEASDLPDGMLEDAMYALGDVTFWADDEDGRLYVCRDEKEQKKVARTHANLRELDVEEAIDFVKTNYGDCFDWPYEVKVVDRKE